MDVLILLLRLLLRLEGASTGTAGLLPVSLRGDSRAASARGMIMAEDGRVCWASSPCSSRRLSETLMRVSGISRAQIEKVFQFCRRTGQPLGEHMVSLGILTREQLREALLEHTTSALLQIGYLVQQGKAAPEHFQVHRERTYSPMFRFGGLELVLEMIRREPELSVALGKPPGTFTRWAPKVEHAVCFLETGWESVPGIPVQCNHDGLQLTLKDAMEIFSRSWDMVEPEALAAADIHPFSTVVRNKSHGWLTCHTPPYLCIYQLDKPAQMGSILSGVLKESHWGDSLER